MKNKKKFQKNKKTKTKKKKRNMIYELNMNTEKHQTAKK